MPNDVYTFLAKGARYWFLLLMVLIVLRSIRCFHSDRKKMKQHLQKIPHEGYIGEMVIIWAKDQRNLGKRFRIASRGSIGGTHFCDVILPSHAAKKYRIFFYLKENTGLVIETAGREAVNIKGRKLDDDKAVMLNGSSLEFDDIRLQLVLYPEYAVKIASFATTDGDHDSDGVCPPETVSSPDDYGPEVHFR